MTFDPSRLTRDQLKRHVAGLEIQSDAPDGPERRPGAVMLIMLATPQGPGILYTKRAMDLDQHPGQISFPGGAIEEGDISFEAAAARETLEEIGIESKELEVFGPLPCQPVLTRWLIHPFAAWWDRPRPLSPSKTEVERIIITPLAELAAQHHKGSWRTREPEKASRYLISGEILWGATARITGRFLDSLIGQF
ncbi:CoA pyrophosphatase [Deltaproteobacteria bacterium OttesenSCG-928-K17]|nr:CoA pyrophosphatase [Deltaproteobacteria bacterium OttesenSCG-928-K17]